MSSRILISNLKNNIKSMDYPKVNQLLGKIAARRSWIDFSWKTSNELFFSDKKQSIVEQYHNSQNVLYYERFQSNSALSNDFKIRFRDDLGGHFVQRKIATCLNRERNQNRRSILSVWSLGKKNYYLQIVTSIPAMTGSFNKTRSHPTKRKWTKVGAVIIV